MECISISLHPDEMLFRAVEPIEMYWNYQTQRPTSGAFKSSKGLSTDRAHNREKQECIGYLKATKRGSIVSFLVCHCYGCDIFVKPDPTPRNPFHTLVLKSQTEYALSKRQAKWLADNAKVELYALAVT